MWVPNGSNDIRGPRFILVLVSGSQWASVWCYDYDGVVMSRECWGMCGVPVKILDNVSLTRWGA